MVMFESVDILVNCKPKVVEASTESPLNGEWETWIVEALRSCKYVPSNVLDSVPLCQVATLLKVIDRWNLWKPGDERLIEREPSGSASLRAHF